MTNGKDPNEFFRKADDALKAKISPELRDRLEQTFQEWVEETSPKTSLLQKVFRWFWFPVLAVAGYQAYDKVLLPYLANQDKAQRTAITEPVENSDPAESPEQATAIAPKTAANTATEKTDEKQNLDEKTTVQNATASASGTSFQSGGIIYQKSKDTEKSESKDSEKTKEKLADKIVSISQLPLLAPKLNSANWSFGPSNADIQMSWKTMMLPPSTVFRVQTREFGTSEFENLPATAPVAETIRVTVDSVSEVLLEDQEVRVQACNSDQCSEWSNAVRLNTHAAKLNDARARLLRTDGVQTLAFRWKNSVSQAGGATVEITVENLATQETKIVSVQTMVQKASVPSPSTNQHYRIVFKTSKTLPNGMTLHWTKKLVRCQGDANNDGTVNSDDETFVQSYLSAPIVIPNVVDPFDYLHPADLDGNMLVNPTDVSITTHDPGPCPTP